MAGPRLVTTAVVLLLCWGTCQTHAQANVSITVEGTPPPGFTPGPNEYRAASGPYTFTCTATGGAGSGDFQYVWTSTCQPSCAFQTTSTGATSVIEREALHSGDGGTHTCTATRGGESKSDSIDVTIEGVGIYILVGSSVTGTQPSNGLVITSNPSSGGKRRFRFFCRSNSSAIGAGELIGLDENPVIGNSSFFGFQSPTNGGELRVESIVNTHDLLTASEQGVYTCRMPFEGGGEGEINIGVYTNGFDTNPSITNPLVFTWGSSSSTLTCISNTSVATTVTFMRNNSTVGPLRDRESMEFGAVTYQLTQTVTNRAQSTYENVLTINQPLADIVGSTFTCSVENRIGTSPVSQPLTIMMVVSISITFNGASPPGFTPGPNEYRAASGPYTFTCKATWGGGSGDYEYMWTSTCADCNFQTSSTGAISVIERQALHSGDSGTHTCTATRGGQSASDSIDITIVGAGIFVFDGSGETGTQPNNGLVISNNPDSGQRFRFFCRSNSLTIGVGQFFGPDGSPVVGDTFFDFQTPTNGGELRVRSIVGNQSPLTASQQGVYICHMPLKGGGEGEINIGVYPSGFNAIPSIINPLVFTPGSSSSTLTCTSTTSVATTVTFMRDNSTVGPLRDGESMEFGGVTYQLTQIVTNRVQSTYQNVLTINQPLADIVDSTFTCSVENTIDSSLDSQPLMALDVTVLLTTSGSTVVGMSYTLTCTVSGADNLEANISIEFTGPNSGSGTGTSLQLPLILDLTDAGEYTCTATVSSGLLSNDLIFTDTEDVTIPIPSATVDVRHDGEGTIYAGSVLTLTCEISLVGSVPPSLRDNVTVTTTWFGASENILSSGGMTTVNPVMGSGFSYSSTVVFNTVHINNAGTYTCRATVTHSSPFITGVTMIGDSVVTISPEDPSLTLAVLSSTTRLPNVNSYNIFTLTCTATAPMGVIESKTFIWRRTSGLGGSCGNFPEDTESGTFQITDSDVDQPVSTSVLTVIETTAAVWRYCCLASLLSVTGFSGEVAITVTGPAPPQQPTNLTNIDTRAMSSMIQWTVPIIAYTPETYVVNYGTSMSSLDVTNDPVESGSDFEAVDQVFTVELTGLVDTTTYYYQVVATNEQGSASSVIQNLTTTILRPGPPQNFMLIMRTTRSLSFSWNPPAPIAGVNPPTRYIVKCEPQLEGIDTPAPVNRDISEETATVSGLAPGVTYSCSVTAMNDRGESDRTEQSQTTLETAPTGEPQNFGITPGNDGPTSRELTFSWDLPLPTQRNGIVTNYTIACSPDTETLPLETTLPGEGDLTVWDFRPSAEYTCTIVATNSQGSGPPATATTITNEDAPDGPPQSPSFIVTEDPKKLLFTVQPPQEGLRNGVISSYSVRCIPSDDFQGVTNVTGTISSAGGEVGDFTPTADFICFFTASTRVGPGPETIAGLSITTLPDTPMITSVMNRSTSEVLVEWTITVPETTGPGAITHFTVHVYVDSNAVVNTNGTVMSYIIRNLAPYQLVTVQVSASTSAGEGVRSEAVDGRSSEAPPGPVSNVLWEPQSASSVIVSWSPPLMPNGVILKYSVVLERYEGGPIIDSRDLDSNVFTTMLTQALEAEVPYNVTVTARNSAGEGDPVEIVDFAVESNSPPFPSNVSIQRSSDGREISVSWTPLTLVEAKSLIQFYRVSFDPVSSSRKRQSRTTCSQSPCDVPGTQSSVLITGLDPSTSYVVQVAVVNEGGQRGPSAVVIAAAEDIPTTSGTDTATSPGTDTAAIVGGVVAVVALLIIAGVVVMIVILVMRQRNHESSLSVGTHAESVKWSEVAKSRDRDINTTECTDGYSLVTLPQRRGYEIPTTPCAAYSKSQQVPRIEEVVYEEISIPPAQI